MSLPLLPAERAQYSAIIDGILASGDLQTISAKQIRKGLEAKLDIDISDKKVAVQELILERFDHAQNIASVPIPTTEASPKPTPAAAPTTNGHPIKTGSKVKRESTPSATTSSPSTSTPSASVRKSEPDSDSEEISPPKKKRKANKEVDDAKLAAMLQAQENSRARSTRGGGSKKVNKIAKKPRKKREKSAKKIKADDDSEVELGSDGEVKQKEKKGGFHKQYHLSVSLAELVNAPTLSRPQVVKKLWEYIKEHNLQDPKDKRQIGCDEKLQSVFKQDKVHMFTMNKLLGKHLYDIEEE